MLLGFKQRFAEPILMGKKVFTLRKNRKVKAKMGEQLHMYTGLRTSNCKLITKKETLISTQRAWIKMEVHFTSRKELAPMYDLKICVDGRRLNFEEHHQFVRYDGFKDEWDFVKYWVSTSIKKSEIQIGVRITIVGSMVLHHWTDLQY